MAGADACDLTQTAHGMRCSLEDSGWRVIVRSKTEAAKWLSSKAGKKSLFETKAAAIAGMDAIRMIIFGDSVATFFSKAHYDLDAVADVRQVGYVWEGRASLSAMVGKTTPAFSIYVSRCLCIMPFTFFLQRVITNNFPVEDEEEEEHDPMEVDDGGDE